MSGGGKSGKSKGPSLQEQMAAQQQAIEMARPKDVQLQTTGWGGMGPNIPANAMGMGTAVTGQGVTAPGWATGDWAMPWWGQQAPNVGAAMMQQAKQAAPQPPSAAPAQGGGQQQQGDPRLQEFMQRRRFGKGSGIGGGMVADNEGRLGWSLAAPSQQDQYSGMQPYYGPAYQGPQGGQGPMDIRQLLAMRGMR
jgi:hypothetical protein